VPEPRLDQDRDVMQRFRIGLTGLACVFLLVLIAAALFGNQHIARKSPPEEPLAELGVTPGGSSTAGPGTAVKPPHEPLAELGVTPGGSHASGSAPASPAADHPAGASSR
jgi:hypothetical protein